MQLTADEVLHLASLARLSLTPEDVERYRGELSAVLQYVSELARVDTSDVPPTHEVGLTNRLRSDVLQASSELTRAMLIAAFPEHSGDLLSVPSVIHTTADKK